MLIYSSSSLSSSFIIHSSTVSEFENYKQLSKKMKFSSKILTLDVYQEKDSRVPVVRVFGPHEKTGRSCCVHIKGAFPYLFVR